MDKIIEFLTPAQGNINYFLLRIWMGALVCTPPPLSMGYTAYVLAFRWNDLLIAIARYGGKAPMAQQYYDMGLLAGLLVPLPVNMFAYLVVKIEKKYGKLGQ